MERSVVVVGGGIAGLAVGFELVRSGADVLVLEASPRAGGSIRSERRSGFLCEWGPNGILDDAPATIDLVGRLGLGPRVVRAIDGAGRRFVVRGGVLREMSSALSLRGRLRALTGSFFARRPGKTDESVHAFACRKLGREAARILVDAAVTGIWAGDASELSMRSALPELATGLMRRSGRLTTFPNGLAELPDALAASLGPRLRLRTLVTGIEPVSGGFRVHASGAPPIDAAAVVLACPAWMSAALLAPLDATLTEHLSCIPSVPVAVVQLGFASKDAAGLKGFGFLVPRGESDSVLGVLLPSNIFPGRAPDGRLLATVMMGGARDRAVIDAADHSLFDRACAALAAFAGVRVAPELALAIRHERAIPQYVVGHAARLGAIESRLSKLPGVVLAGSCYRGISINACIADASLVAGWVR